MIVVRSEFVLMSTPPAPVTVPAIVTDVKFPLDEIVTVVKVPSVETVSKSPWLESVNAGPAVSAVVALPSNAPVPVKLTRSLPLTVISTILSAVKFCTSSPIVIDPS